jgi:hypothetical protein
MRAKEMSGLRFDKLLVIAQAKPLKDGTAVWRCICDCGQERLIPGNSLRAGRNKSCGCASPKFTHERVTKHGQSRTRTYRIWNGMKQRCSPIAYGKSKRLYYDKGITVCDRWRNSFEAFLEDMKEAPEGGTIDRIDGNGNYEPGNCRWASKKEQANNTSVNFVVTHSGQSLTVAMWAEKLNMKANTLLYRLRRGISVERALNKTMPNRP